MGRSIEIVPGALCHWAAPEGDRRVLLSASLVRDLRVRAIEGFVSLPKRGVEIGGILFGHARGATVRIEGFEEAPCEHRYGPSYALSETDRAQLSEILRQRQGEGSLPVVGFFRSFTSRDPLIEAADEEFVQQHFPRGDFLFLMVQPLSPERCVASFRFFRDGVLQTETESEASTFPFDPAQMECVESQPVEAAAPSRAPVPAVAASAAPADTAQLPVEEEAPPVLPPPYRSRSAPTLWGENSLRSRSRWWVPVAICLVAGVLGAVIYELWLVAQAPRWAELHLDARPSGQQIQITWDSNAPQAVGATRALLAVTDGNTHRDIELTPAEVKSGKYGYTPSHGDVELRLILYAKGVGVSGDAVRLASVPSLVETKAESKQPSEADRTAPVEAAASREPAPAKPPTTVHEVQPNIPEGIRSRIRQRIIIPVDVQINEKGRVTGAAAEIRGDDGLRRYLAEQSQKAARQWRFTPARSQSGARVASNKTVHFVFTP